MPDRACRGTRARLGLRGRGRLGAVLDARDRVRRAGLRGDRARPADGGWVRTHGPDDLAAPVLRGRGRVALGLRVPGARPGARDPGDAAVAAPDLPRSLR